MECGACALNCPQEAIEVNAGVGCAAAIIIGHSREENQPAALQPVAAAAPEAAHL